MPLSRRYTSLVVPVSGPANNLQWQDAPHVSMFDIFFPLWTNVFVCIQNLGFFIHRVHG